MSYRTWHNYGYGICTDEIKTTPERIEKLLALAPEFSEHVHNVLIDWEITEATVEDYEEVAQEHDNGYYGLASLLKLVMQEAEGLEFASCDNYNCYNFVLYCPCFPWQVTEKEKDLTEEKLRLIFAKYVNILTDQEIEFEYQVVSNGG